MTEKPTLTRQQCPLCKEFLPGLKKGDTFLCLRCLEKMTPGGVYS